MKGELVHTAAVPPYSLHSANRSATLRGSSGTSHRVSCPGSTGIWTFSLRADPSDAISASTPRVHRLEERP